MRHASTITTPPRFRAPVRVTIIGDTVTVEDADQPQGSAGRGRYTYTDDALTGTGPLSDSARDHIAGVIAGLVAPPMGLA